MGNGFIPTGTGPAGERFGRNSDGLAYKADGTPRRKRRTFSAVERIANHAKAAAGMMAGIGRNVVKSLTGLASFRNHVGTFRKWVRDCKAYATPEACEARKAYFLRMAAAVDAKHAAAVRWLPKAAPAIAAIDSLLARTGVEVAKATEAAGGVPPSDAECSAIVGRLLSPEVLATVEAAGDPANDPFADFRRNAAEPEVESDPEGESLSDDDDADEDDAE